MHTAESSGDRGSAFEGVNLRHASMLLALFESSQLREKQILERRYLTSAQHFNETLNYLDAVEILKTTGEVIAEGKKFGAAVDSLKSGQESFFRLMVNLTLETKSQYAAELKAFISRFHPDENGEPVLQRLTENDSDFAPRNFLIDVGAVELNYTTTRCKLGSQLHEFYLKSERQEGLTPARLRSIQIQQEEIGLLAEKEVLAQEKALVDPTFRHLVQHVAQFNVAAGFDIFSIRTRGNGISERRYIEVKAVGRTEFKFYWSKNEVAAARKYGDNYFLYLLPVYGGQPRLAEKLVIKNPANNLLNNKVEWEISSELFECRKR